MNQSHLDFLLSMPGIIILSIVFILLFPLWKVLIWKLFAFDKKVKKIQFDKKSSEVRTGKIVESLAPLLDSFPVDIKKEGSSTVFLGQPIDYVHFDPEEGITFIEVKSGNAKLSSMQKKIIDHIEAGNVFWAEMKVNK